MIDFALSRAKAGFHVFPLSPGTKIPIEGSRGFEDATTDLDTIRRWWEQTPDANIGVYPGASGHVVLDIDTKDPNYADPAATIADIEERVGGLPDTFTVRTPSGGLHLYFRNGGASRDGSDVESSVRRVHPAVDIRAKGGYVVAGGSRLPSGRYSVIRPVEPAAIPSELVRLCERKRSETGLDGPAAGGPLDNSKLDLDLQVNVTAARRFLEQTAPAIEGQGGNNHTYQTAGIVKDYGLSPEKTLELLLETWNDRCSPPWDTGELEEIVKHVHKYGNRAPGARGLDQDTLSAMARQVSDLPQGRVGRLYRLTRSQLSRLPDPVWCVTSALEARSLALLVGRYGSYKSFCALDIGLSVATGVHWGNYPVARGPVLYLAGEGAPGLKSRIDAWEAVREVQVDDRYFSLVPTMPHFDSPEDFEWIKRQLTDMATYCGSVEDTPVSGVDQSAQRGDNPRDRDNGEAQGVGRRSQADVPGANGATDPSVLRPVHSGENEISAGELGRGSNGSETLHGGLRHDGAIPQTLEGALAGPPGDGTGETPDRQLDELESSGLRVEDGRGSERILDARNTQQPVQGTRVASPLLIVDTVARAAVGMDENSNRDMQVFIDRCDELVEECNATVLLIHHSGKDEDKGSRGATALPASVHTEIRIDPTDRAFKLTMTKQKNAEAWRKPLGFKAVSAASSMAFVRDDNVAVSQSALLQENRVKILDRILEAQTVPLTSSALSDAMCSVLETEDPAAVTKWVRRQAHKDPRAYRDGEGSTAPWYWRPGPSEDKDAKMAKLKAKFGSSFESNEAGDDETDGVTGSDLW